MPIQNNTLKVPADFPSVGAALNAAKAGDTIRVSTGTYHEKIQITKSDLTLKGEDGAVIQIDDSLFTPLDEIPGTGGLFVPGWTVGVLPDPGGSPVDQYTDRVKISGFAFQHSGKSVAAMGVHAAHDCRIAQNIIMSSGLGGINIHSNTFGLEINHNKISRSAGLTSAVPDSGGITFTSLALAVDPGQRRPAKDAQVHDNHVSGFFFGILLQDFEGGAVKDNHCLANVRGFRLRAVKNLHMANNVANNSGPDAQNPDGSVALQAAGISMKNATSSNISHNDCKGNARGFLLQADEAFLDERGYPASEADSLNQNHFEGNTMGDLVVEPGIVFNNG
jgi:nitrous oxidase accessory protein NosD